MDCKRAKYLIAAIATLLAPAANAEDRTPSDIFTAAVKAHPQQALSVAYTFGADAPTVLTAGPTERRGSIMVGPNARWHIGSITKSFTSTMVLQLVDRGKLDLDAPIKRYLPAHAETMHPQWQEITLRQLLSHTSGLPANASRKVMRDTYDDAAAAGRHRVMSGLWGDPLEGTPGAFVYSNLGYVFAGMILEATYDMPWEDAVKAYVAAPLGLTSLGFGAPVEADAPLGHSRFFGLKTSIPAPDPGSDNPKWMAPAGTLHLSMSDLIKWGQFHVNACAGKFPDLLSQQSCQTLQAPILDDYALGWATDTSSTLGPIIWHNGSNTLWYAMISILPEQELVVAAAMNIEKQNTVDDLVDTLTQALISRQR